MAFSSAAVEPPVKERATDLMTMHLEHALVAQTRLVARAKLLALSKTCSQAPGSLHPFLLVSFRLPALKLTFRDSWHQAEVE